MASGKFYPNRMGYLETLNGEDAYATCNNVGGSISNAANSAGHGRYTHDTIHGRSRIHTRVKTADSKSFFQERATRTLTKCASRQRVR